MKGEVKEGKGRKQDEGGWMSVWSAQGGRREKGKDKE